MNKSALLLVCAAFAVISCAQPRQAPQPATPTQIVGTPPPAAPAPPPAAEPEQPPAAEEPAEPEQPQAEPAPQITCKLPGGWVSLPSSRLPEGITAVYLKPQEGQVVVRPAPAAGKTPTEQADIVRKLVAANNKGIKMSKVATSKDGKSASFTIDAGETHAKLVIRKLGPDDSYSFFAKWDATKEKDVAPDIDNIIKSAALQK